MWQELLSGLIGSVGGAVLGVIGAYALAVRTIRQTHESGKRLAREQLAFEAAGRIAVELAVLHDLFDDIMRTFAAATVDQLVRIPAHAQAPIRHAADELRRRIVVDTPLLPTQLAKNIIEAREVLREVLGPLVDRTPTKSELVSLRTRLLLTQDHIGAFRQRS